MINLKIGGILLVVGAALFLLSDTLPGESEAAAYAVFLGLILFLVGLILAFVGIVQALISTIKNRRQ